MDTPLFLLQPVLPWAPLLQRQVCLQPVPPFQSVVSPIEDVTMNTINLSMKVMYLSTKEFPHPIDSEET